MANVVRPLMAWMRWHCHYCSSLTLHHHHHLLHSPVIYTNSSQSLSFFTKSSSHRNFHLQSRGLKLSNAPAPSDFQDSDSESDSDAKKSRNEKKREARRAVRWGMELAAFSTPQIKRILRVASLKQEVFEALVIVKRFGRDVREGKRRQYSYIGRLLREAEAEPELMDSLIQATKDGDMSKLHALSGSGTVSIEDDDEEADKTEFEEEEEGIHDYIDTANRWFEGLIAKDIYVTKEIYSVQSVEFDRQELRKLVRKVHSAQDHQVMSGENEGEIEPALLGARRALTRFLRALAKSLPTE